MASPESAADGCCLAAAQCSFYSLFVLLLQCAISTLADYYVEGPYTVPPVARSALASTYVSSGNLTLPEYISRSQARIAVSYLLLVSLLRRGTPLACLQAQW